MSSSPPLSATLAALRPSGDLRVAIPIALGLAASSYFFYGNLACAWFGAIPAIQRTGMPLDTRARVNLFAFFYNTAKVHFVASMAAAALSYLTAAYYTPSAVLRTLLVVGAAVGFSVIPYTVLAMLPTNGTLLGIRDRLERTESDGKEDARVVAQLLEKWRKAHQIRIALGLAAVLTGVVAISN